MRLFAGVAALAVLGSAGCSLVLLLRLDGVRVAHFLAAHEALPYAIAIWWGVLAPVPLAVAALMAARTPWPWVAAMALHLAVLVALAARLRHLLDPVSLAAVGMVLAVGLASVVAAVALPRTTTATAPGPPPARPRGSWS